MFLPEEKSTPPPKPKCKSVDEPVEKRTRVIEDSDPKAKERVRKRPPIDMDLKKERTSTWGVPVITSTFSGSLPLDGGMSLLSKEIRGKEKFAWKKNRTEDT